jgi:Ferritin-like domain
MMSQHELRHAEDRTPNLTSRRAFLRTGFALGAGALGAGLLANEAPSALAAKSSAAEITNGDVAILRFLAALEIIEADLWQQYNELGGIQDHEVPGGSGSEAFTEALETLDDDMPQYIHDNTEDEFSHFRFLNAYLQSKGAQPVNLARFRTLPSSKATGARDVDRLTNLMKLTVDTSWYTRYRSRTKNPDFGDTFPQAIPDLSNGMFTAIPRDDGDLFPNRHIQAIANTAAFHFGFIEQGGSSLYPALAQRVKNPEVLRILLSIGPTETAHFQIWHDVAGDAPPLRDPTNGLKFPDLNAAPFGGEDFETSLVMPEPTIFLRRKFPVVSIIRPTETKGAAMGAVKALRDDGLFRGQSQKFFDVLGRLAQEADAARRY